MRSRRVAKSRVAGEHGRRGRHLPMHVQQPPVGRGLGVLERRLHDQVGWLRVGQERNSVSGVHREKSLSW